MKYASGYIPGAAWIAKPRFSAAVEACMLAIVTAMLKRDTKYRSPTACLTPSFDKLAFEIRAAMSRACNREINIIRWEELTPDGGTPGVTKHGEEAKVEEEIAAVALDLDDWAIVLASLDHAPTRGKILAQIDVEESAAA